MPLPLAAPVVMSVGRYILTAGAKRAAKKYGDDVVKQVQKSAKFKKLQKKEMEDRVASAKAVKEGKPSEMTTNFKSKARKGDPYKLKERGEFAGEKLPDYEIAEIPLKFYFVHLFVSNQTLCNLIHTHHTNLYRLKWNLDFVEVLPLFNSSKWF